MKEIKNKDPYQAVHLKVAKAEETHTNRFGVSCLEIGPSFSRKASGPRPAYYDGDVFMYVGCKIHNEDLRAKESDVGSSITVQGGHVHLYIRRKKIPDMNEKTHRDVFVVIDPAKKITYRQRGSLESVTLKRFDESSAGELLEGVLSDDASKIESSLISAGCLDEDMI